MEDATNGRLGLVEIFHSFQGEGYNSGRPALFIRFAGCNLDCHFADGAICDTPWRKTRLKLTLTELTEWVESHRNPTNGRRPLVILTGGEPLMSPFFDMLVNSLVSRLWHVCVETNGTIWKEGLTACSHVVVSPKDMVAHGKPLGSPEVSQRVVSLPPDEYRFVIHAGSPMPPWHPTRAAGRHFLSPAVKSDGSGELWKQGFPGFADGAVDRCLEIMDEDPGWRLSLQTHKIIGVR